MDRASHGVLVRPIAPDSPLVENVRSIWRANSAWLGFFPAGAFDDHARSGGLLGAQGPDGHLKGYLAFRQSRNRAVIVHLCVHKAFRGHGIARALVDELKRATSALLGASLTCRTDFDASSMWPRLGFVAIRELPARQFGHTLKRWWLDYGHPDLFSGSQTAPLAVIDANVFFDLLDPTNPRSTESAALTADWLLDAFTLSITPELLNEIDRSRNLAGRERARHFAASLPQTIGPPREWNSVFHSLSGWLRQQQSLSDESDLRQLAHAIAEGALYFVTRDGSLLNHSGRLRSEHEIIVVRPAALVAARDATIRPYAYAPERLDGSSLTIRRVCTDEEQDLARAFQNYALGETNAGLPMSLRAAMAQPKRYHAEVVVDESSAPVGLIVTTTADHRRRIEILRVATYGIGPTLARHLLWRCVVRDAESSVTSVDVTDAFAPDSVNDDAGGRGLRENRDGLDEANTPRHIRSRDVDE